MSIQNAQQQVDDWIQNHGVRYFNELTNMAQLTEEVGEVARIIARRYGEQSEKDSDKGKDLGEELADVTDSWMHESYGRKIEKAMNYRAAGVPINIVTEERWAEAGQFK